MTFSERPPSGAEFTLITNERGNACKEFSLDDCRKLTTKPSAQVWEGAFARVAAASLDDFLRLRSLFNDPSTCIIYGVPKNGSEKGALATKAERWRFPGSLARCRDDFAFRENLPGVLFLDHDRRKGPDAKRWTWQELDAAFCEALPGLNETRRAWLPSSSAFLNRELDDYELRGAGGWRMYCLIDDAAAIPRILDYLFQRLWGLGHGFIEISEGGSALVRTLIDGCTGTSERIDFIADPILGPGTLRRVPAEFPVLLGGKPMLASGAVPLPERMADWRQNNAGVCEARAAAKPRLESLRAEIVERRLPEFRKANPVATVEELRRSIRAAMEDGAPLGLDFVLYRPDWTPITVRNLISLIILLGDAIELLDPQEPDYDGGRQVAQAYFNAGTNSAYIHSFAHGGRTFDLTRAVRELQAEAPTEVKLPATQPACPQHGPVTGGSAPAGMKGDNLPGAMLTARELKDMAFPPQKFICQGLISEGCSILGARPKAGKSWLALDLARAVATGGEALGRRCEQGDVLYLALEDTPRRLKDRLARIEQSSGDWSDALRFANEWPKGEAAVDKFHEWRRCVSNPRLIIVDTFQKVKGAPKSRNGPNYAEDYDAGAVFQSFTKDTGVSILLIHHTKKQDAEDPFDTLSGTLGTNAAADSLHVIKPAPKSGSMMLHGRGRDLAEYAIPIEFDKDTCRWTKGTLFEVPNCSATEQKIIGAFRNVGAFEMTPSDVHKATGLDYDLAKRTMGRLAEKGTLTKPSRGVYALRDIPPNDLERVSAFYP
ncbi:MAG: AAA family ATPase [Rhodomicrobium sp.]